jgi:hypothetical protein
MAAPMVSSDDAIVQTRRAEIKRRYGHKWDDPKVKLERVRSLRRVQVLSLLRDRHGATLPDDEHGRRALQILFELGLDGIAAYGLAPWIGGEQEFKRLCDATDGNWRDYSKKRDIGDPTIDPKVIPERLGERLEMTFEEYKRLELTHIRPCDAPRHIVDQHIRDGRADRQRRDRAKAKQAKPPSNRARALRYALNYEWRSRRALTEYACKRLPEFAGLDHAAGGKAVLRAARELEKLGIAMTKIEDGPGDLKVLYVKLSAAEIEADRQEMLYELSMEEGDVTDVGPAR